MGRSTVRDRMGLREAVTLLCPGCGKRVMEAWPSDFVAGTCGPGVDYVLYGAERDYSLARPASPAARNGIRNLAEEDWYSIRCGRCPHVSQGREGTLREMALRWPGGRRTLPS